MADWYNKERVSQPGATVLNRWLATESPSAKKAQRAAVSSGFSKRSFSAGLGSRTTGNWQAINSSIDQDLRGSLDMLRARSRQQTQNNPYAAKFLKMVANNVVGAQGFDFQANVTDPSGRADDLANDAIERAFADWSMMGVCDVTGKLGFADACRLIMRTVACDGEALVRIVRGAGVNKFGYALQLLDIDRLLVSQNGRAPNGNLVRMGVEIDDFGRPVAYWLRKSHPGEALGSGVLTTQERVPAEDCFHLFMPLRPEQRRGAPWMAPALESMYHLGEFDQSALLAARKGADTLGFFVSPDGNAPPIGDGVDAQGNAIEISIPGSYDTLPEGYDFRPNNSTYPSDVYERFAKACLRRIASGLGVAFHALGNDLTEVNFSSIRAGTLEERDGWMEIQAWFIEAFVTPIYLDWLQMSLGFGAITMPNGSALPAVKYDKFKRHTFQGRRWNWVDPRADMEAAIAAVNNGFKSRTQICAEQGLDRDTVWRQLANEEADLKRMGIKLSPPTGYMPPPLDPANDPNQSKNKG